MHKMERIDINKSSSVLSTIASSCCSVGVQSVLGDFLSKFVNEAGQATALPFAIQDRIVLPRGEKIHRACAGIHGEVCCISNVNSNKLLVCADGRNWETVYQADDIIPRIAHDGEHYYLPLFNKRIIDVLDSTFRRVSTIDLAGEPALATLSTICNASCDKQGRLVCSGTGDKGIIHFLIDRPSHDYSVVLLGKNIVIRNGDCMATDSSYLLIAHNRIVVIDGNSDAGRMQIVNSVPVPAKFLTILPWKDRYLVPLISGEIVLYDLGLSLVGHSDFLQRNGIDDIGLIPLMVDGGRSDSALLYGLQGNDIYTVQLNSNKGESR
ncbi:hypothetical protein [Pseudodesulfovibrio portus]|uniref:NHL repeat containing protein n=1 Tax=Pseudodesulfovibrio portus TaxID=231439 RepID=A0ABM8ATR1_9BACT|nr:hypothetical protein [Pseudodesulfovibrio portus]BDQ34700.1 hypothetical protein JCM14722_22420 [Pseudodesulfovibrio portus]